MKLINIGNTFEQPSVTSKLFYVLYISVVRELFKNNYRYTQGGVQ
jgi:hypothetical protein